MDIRKIKLPQQNVRALIAPETFNEETNTVDVVFTTDERVMRFPFFDDPFLEELGMKPSEVRMERLENGAPVLNNHNSSDLNDQIGVVASASVDGKAGHATLRLSERESLKDIVQDIKSGIIRNISVGYRVHKFEQIEDNSTEIRVLRAVDWEPMEISFVTVPADKNAQVKSDLKREDEKLYEAEIKTIHKGTEMDEKTNPETVVEKTEELTEVAVQETPVEEKKEEVVVEEVNVQEVVEQARKEDQKRISEILDLGKKFNIDVNDYLVNGINVDEVRKNIMETLAKRGQEKRTESMNENKIEVGKTDLEKKKEGLTEAMLFKSKIKGTDGQDRYKMTENAQRFHNLSLLEMAKVTLDERGVETFNKSKLWLAERAFHSNSDFKEILANVANKSLRDAYQAAQQTFMPFTRMVDAPDLKEISRTQFGEGELLSEVLEGENYKHGTVSESAEKYRVRKFGKIINVTEETLINDDLGAFSRIPSMLGQRAMDLQSDLAWGIIKDNALMADGNALFSAAHTNLLAAGGVLGETALGSARELYRKQVGLDGMKLNLSPVFLAVPAALEVVAEKLIASIQPDSTSSFNPFGPTGRTPLSLIVEPRLDDQSALEWYLMGSLGQIDMIEMASLAGASGPMITQDEGFDVDGLRIKIKMWTSAKAIDHRGLLKSDGVA